MAPIDCRLSSLVLRTGAATVVVPSVFSVIVRAPFTSPSATVATRVVSVASAPVTAAEVSAASSEAEITSEFTVVPFVPTIFTVRVGVPDVVLTVVAEREDVL